MSLPRTYDSKRHPKSAGVDDVAREGKDNSWWDRMFRRDGTQSDQALDDERAEGLQGGMVRDSLQRRFNLPPSEILIEDYACALHHGILLQGRMYVYPRHVCFACDLIAKTRTICIPFTDVTDIRKATTALIFHNAIEIHTTEHKYLFASFLFRREAYKGLTNFWTISRAIVSALRDAKSLEEEEEEDEALKAAVEAAQTDGSACPEAPGALEALHARGDSSAGAVGAGGGGQQRRSPGAPSASWRGGCRGRRRLELTEPCAHVSPPPLLFTLRVSLLDASGSADPALPGAPHTARAPGRVAAPARRRPAREVAPGRAHAQAPGREQLGARPGAGGRPCAGGAAGAPDARNRGPAPRCAAGPGHNGARPQPCS